MLLGRGRQVFADHGSPTASELLRAVSQRHHLTLVEPPREHPDAAYFLYRARSCRAGTVVFAETTGRIDLPCAWMRVDLSVSDTAVVVEALGYRDVRLFFAATLLLGGPLIVAAVASWSRGPVALVVAGMGAALISAGIWVYRRRARVQPQAVEELRRAWEELKGSPPHAATECRVGGGR